MGGVLRTLSGGQDGELATLWVPLEARERDWERERVRGGRESGREGEREREGVLARKFH